jgi:hypothetical protein
MATAGREALHEVAQIGFALAAWLGEPHADSHLSLLNDQPHRLETAEHQAGRVSSLNT